MKTLNGLTAGHVAQFMSKFTPFFIRHGGAVKGRVCGPRRCSEDLEQGGVEIPTIYTFTCGTIMFLINLRPKSQNL